MSVFVKQLNILVVEDNPGDYFLIEEYLSDERLPGNIFHVRTLVELKAKLLTNTLFDIILLDLSLPDGSGEALVREVLAIAHEIPVIVLTGYADKDFGVRSLSWGIADYLLKDELNASLLTKSTLYSIERRKINISLRESEKRYKELFHLNPVPMWVYEINTLQFLDVNQAAIAHYGYSKEEFLKMNILQIRPKESIPEVIETIHEIKNYGKSVKKIWRHLKKNGELMYVEIEGNLIDFVGKKARLILATDITEKLEVENALKISEQRFKVLVQDGADLMTIIDRDARFRYVSPNHATIVGYEPVDLLYKKVYEFVHKDDIKRMLETTNSLNLHKSVSIAPYRFKHANGSWVWLETTITNLLNDSAIQGIVSNSRDIGKRIEYERKLRQTNERYEAVAQATSDAIWDCDLRTKKTFITGNGYQKLFGYAFVNEYLDMNFWEDHLHPDDKERATGILADALVNSRTQCSSEYRFLKADGEYAYVHDRAFIIYENNKPVRALGAMQDITTRKYQESILAIEKEIYALNATEGISLDDILEKLIDDIEDLIPHSICSIVRLKDGKTLHHIAGNAIPEAYIMAIEGLTIGPTAGSCGTAMFLGEPVIVTDINKDYLWRNYRDIAHEHNLNACWSIPIKKSDGEVIGSFATYYHTNKSPKPHETSFIERAANLVGVLLENREASEKIKQSKERYDIVMKATSDTIWDLDIIKDRITYNKGISRIFGYSLDHLEIENVQEWWKKSIHPEDLGKVGDKLNDVFEKRQSKIQIEYRFRCADGSYKYVLDRGFIVVDNDHNPIRIIGAMQDITRKKEEENRLRLLESVITNATDAVLITEANLIEEPGPVIVYVNDAFTKMTGYSREEVIGKNPRFLQGENTDKHELQKLKSALLNRESHEMELINYKKNGEEFWVNISIAPMADSTGLYTHWIAIQRDVTERKNREIEREQLIKELNNSNEDLRHFSYITSHNFKAPLSNLIGFLNIIDEIPIENQMLSQIIQGFKVSTHLLNDTINDLIKILIIRDTDSFEQKNISFTKIMNQVMTQVENLIVESGAKIETDFKSAPSVIFNETYLESILLNLLTNAIKYRAYNRPLKVQVTTEHQAGFVVLTFEDNGIGVDLEKHKEKMFGLYQKFHDRPNSKGMGLYLIKSQLESLGGSIDVESKVDVGTRFILKFKQQNDKKTTLH
ncbi:PAS domain S-box protein [Emticicia sp. BO119]|uniref:PAS domain S-box protein n=1 Tax=Emticicia sp. BO119 TaxID=2757768 RepID=UPI0015F0F83B|nr:PAS domain S-box protein [Emticicia sp. BO119]MBA4848834.1 PAS domain S-box protein [Emticicia sp. BO119]